MTSYLLSWWYGTHTSEAGTESIVQETKSDAISVAEEEHATPTLTVVPPPVEESDTTHKHDDTAQGSEKSTSNDKRKPKPSSYLFVSAANEDSPALIEDYDDTPPSFPSLNSIQRSQSSRLEGMARSDIVKKKTDFELMPPPPNPPQLGVTPPKAVQLIPTVSLSTSNSRSKLTSYTANLRVPATLATSSASLMPPPTTTRPPPALTKAKRGKVVLAPGHSPLDWAALKKSGQDLRGTLGLLRVTPSMLQKHKTVDDAWTAIDGRVYNVTPYLDYHPGGVKELMRVAGRDGTKLFASTHAWVNAEFMLDECFVGILVPEGSVRYESDDD